MILLNHIILVGIIGFAFLFAWYWLFVAPITHYCLRINRRTDWHGIIAGLFISSIGHYFRTATIAVLTHVLWQQQSDWIATYMFPAFCSISLCIPPPPAISAYYEFLNLIHMRYISPVAIALYFYSLHNAKLVDNGITAWMLSTFQRSMTVPYLGWLAKLAGILLALYFVCAAIILLITCIRTIKRSVTNVVHRI